MTSRTSGSSHGRRARRAEYVVSMPNMYARGILWGKMVLELGDVCTARNERNGFYADLMFKTKGYFSGTYNAIAGRVRRTAGRPSSSGGSSPDARKTNGAGGGANVDLGEITGKWSGVMEYRPAKVRFAFCCPFAGASRDGDARALFLENAIVFC